MTTGRVWDPAWLRDLLLSALPEETSLHGNVPEARFVYLPASHRKALEPNASVVVGLRGAGKSFWWAALQDSKIRSLVSHLAPHAGVSEKMHVAVGFGETAPGPDTFPGRETLEKLLSDGVAARLIWRTVVAYHADTKDSPLRVLPTWQERIYWVTNNPEIVDQRLAERDEAFAEAHTWFMVLFDALDRSASTWKNMNRLIRGLLETARDFRPYRRLRVKCFLRTDQLDEGEVADFPDASKVLASSVELTWTREDLFGLLWQYLGNASHKGAEHFVQISEAHFGIRWEDTQVGDVRVRRVAPSCIYDEAAQRQLFHSIAGEWMGRDWRRGFPYTWIPNHLADAGGNVSPRSFLAALRAAAQDTNERYPAHDTALHYESIKRGVQRASSIRVRELTEDYPWVHALMEPLSGVVVPCDFAEVALRWKEARAIEALRKSAQRDEEKRLPPAHLEMGVDANGLRRDLEELGIFRRTHDGRVDIPDVYRVGYGLGRRGGVKPLRTKASLGG